MLQLQTVCFCQYFPLGQSTRGTPVEYVCHLLGCFKNNLFFFCDTSESMDEDYIQPIYTRTEAITEEDDKNLAGATKEYRNELQIIIPENPFPEIEVDAYPPLKFSWVIPKKLAAMAFPRNKENVKFIVNQGITHLITLTADKKPPVDGVARLNVSDIPIEEFGVPDLDQVKKFIDICKRADKSGEVKLILIILFIE